MTRDSLRVRLGRRIQRFGRWVAHGGRPHEWRPLSPVYRSRCDCCDMMVYVDSVLKHGGLAGRCPK